MTHPKGKRPTDRRSQQQTISIILADIESEHRAWTRLIAALDSDRMNERIYGEWTPLDTLAHITAWIENAVEIAGAQADPATPDPGPTRGPAGVLHINVEQFNQRVLEDHRGWSRPDLLDWSELVHASLLEALALLPAERVLNGRGRHGARQWFWMPAVQHSGGHRRQLEELLGGDS